MAIDARQTNRMKEEEWYECARCGFNYPRSKVIVQRGLVLCQGSGTVKCVDQPGRDAYRKYPTPQEQPIRELPQNNEDI